MSKEIKTINTELSISNANETLHLAEDLAKFIREKKLFQNIQGKEYVNVEGWQYAGSRLGILPIVEDVTNVSTESEIKYTAKVRLLDMRSDRIVGSGFAICSNKEAGKKFYAEYAIASMAQTRAVGKAYRNILAWILRAAGYEPTPLEEYETVVIEKQERETAQPEPPMPQRDMTNRMEQHIDNTKPKTKAQEKAIFDLLINNHITAEENQKVQAKLPNMTQQGAVECIKWLTGLINQRTLVEA